MSSIVDELRPLLNESGYSFREEDESILIDLPYGFGALQIFDLEDGDDIIGLLDSDWHTHSDCLGPPEIPRAVKIRDFITRVFTDDYYLIEEREEGGRPIKVIEEDLESYRKYLPEDTTYRLYNEDKD